MQPLRILDTPVTMRYIKYIIDTSPCECTCVSVRVRVSLHVRDSRLDYVCIVSACMLVYVFKFSVYPLCVS